MDSGFFEKKILSQIQLTLRYTLETYSCHCAGTMTPWRTIIWFMVVVNFVGNFAFRFRIWILLMGVDKIVDTLEN